MSASLVGSEMCIRDRRLIAHALRRGRHAGDRPGVAEDIAFGCSIGPVSYTHLTLPTICSV
eukprot:14977800-Alexandrium_andersonii.AAC.1